MRNLTEDSLTASAIERISKCANPRLKQVMTALLHHLHDFAREVRLSEEEWRIGIAFLTEVGSITDDKRQEFILLSDTLALSALVDLMANPKQSRRATESSLLGPFFRERAPELAIGSDISGGVPGEPIVLRGRVSSVEGASIAGACIDVWQAAPNGKYDVQDDTQPEMNLRARFRTDAEGRYQFRSVKPSSYGVPSDGPVGRMLNALGRHPMRPAHIHFLISAPRYQTLTTALYIAGDRYLDSDVVFGARDSLVVDYLRDGAYREAIEFDFALDPAKA